MLKYIFVVGKSTQKIVFLLTPAGIGDFKSVIRISPSYKTKQTKNRVVGVTVSLFTIKKKKKLICMCDRSFTVGHSTRFLTLQLKQHVLKPRKPNSPEHVNWMTQTERKNEYFTDWVGVSVYLFVFLHFTDWQAFWSFPGVVLVFPCIPRKRVRMRFTA